MKVFISWSGDVSLKVALVFRDWLPSVIQTIEPYVSSEDIDKGARWSTDIAKELENSTFGILCVTKENLEAPWLSFEAGALSKTMDKSFVTPFLFNIKRSEVRGPILQFQSTIFQKEDIKKLVKTLNKACGEVAIPDARLDKSFEVWYPTLEEDLNKINSEVNKVNEEQESDSDTYSSEILEEILELSRDNQRLLRTPDAELIEGIKELKEKIQEQDEKRMIMYEDRRNMKRHSSMLIHEIVDMIMNSGNKRYGFIMILSLIKDDFPWLYDMGKELLEILKSKDKVPEKQEAIMNFRRIIEISFNPPMIRDRVAIKRNMLMNEVPYMLMNCLDELENLYSLR